MVPEPESSSAAQVGPPGERPALFTIHDLVAEFSLTARTLRFYEEKGLLSPLRRGQERLYSRRDRARLKLVLMGRSQSEACELARRALDAAYLPALKGWLEKSVEAKCGAAE